MALPYKLTIKSLIISLNRMFIEESRTVNSKKWQAIDCPMSMRELFNLSFTYKMSEDVEEMAEDVSPNKEWADLHFKERAGGLPLNPGESYNVWPFYKMDKEMRTEGELFSHTYMERIWPKFAGDIFQNLGEDMLSGEFFEEEIWPSRLRGVRYAYGDLNDVVELLKNDPYTRQAYLPIFFPEDTGNTMNQRIPCTIGYHFIMREDKLHIIYYIRSCDYIRHFKDDVYLACRLIYWILEKLKLESEWGEIKPGSLTMHITSLHVFESDMYRLQKEYDKNQQG